jgi:predicted DNA-binding ribbon-helix-helix protein
MKSAIVKRSILLAGRNTSVSLEDAFWKSLKDIAKIKRKLLSELIIEIDVARGKHNLSSAIRQHVLNHYMAQGGRLELGRTGVPPSKIGGYRQDAAVD